MLDETLSLAIESWILYALGCTMIIARIIARLFTLGSIRKLQLDDWIMVSTLIPFTGMTVATNASYAPSTMPGDQALRLKMRFALEVLQVSVNWLVMACLLILYRRIFPATTSSRERIYITYVSVLCILSYLSIQILLPIWCTPARDYFSLAPTNSECATYHNHSIFVLAFDTTTTLLALLLPTLLIPTPRKLLQSALLLLGAAVLATAILARYYALARPFTSTYLYWYAAETTLTISFANLAFLTPLFSASARSSRAQFGLRVWRRSELETVHRLGSAGSGGERDERVSFSKARCSRESGVSCGVPPIKEMGGVKTAVQWELEGGEEGTGVGDRGFEEVGLAK